MALEGVGRKKDVCFWWGGVEGFPVDWLVLDVEVTEGGEEWVPVVLCLFTGGAKGGEVLDVVGVGEALFGHAEEEGLGANF